MKMLNAFYMPQMYLLTAHTFLHIALAFCSLLGNQVKNKEPHIRLPLPQGIKMRPKSVWQLTLACLFSSRHGNAAPIDIKGSYVLEQRGEWAPQAPWRKLYVKLQSINTHSYCITNFNQLLLHLQFGLLSKWWSTP